MTKPASVMLLLLPLLLFGAPQASGATRALLLLGEFSQWVSLEYQYDAQQNDAGGGNSLSQHFFREEYNVQLPYAIFDPHLLSGRLGLGVLLDQDYSSSSNAASVSAFGTSFKYNFSGAVLDRSAFPLNFYGRSELLHAQRDFSAPYDIDLEMYGVSLMLRNRYLPIKVNYSRSSSETKGLSVDGIQQNDTFSLTGSHLLSRRSETEGQLSISDSAYHPEQGGASAANATYEVSLRNKLFLSQSIDDLTLDSKIVRREERRVENGARQDVRSLQIDEMFSWPLGRALLLGAEYSFSSRESLLATDQLQHGRLWLRHRLFESLITQLEGDYRRSDMGTGTEQNLGGTFALSYGKKLPRDSKIQWGFSQRYQVTDRNQGGFSQVVFDEPHGVTAGEPIPDLPAPIVLLNGNALPESIEVRNADPSVRLLPYQLNADYTVEQFGSQSRVVITPTSEIDLGDNLLISYSYLANPELSYATSTRSADFTLLLFNNAYRFYGSWLNSQQELLDGQADLVQLVGQSTYKTGFEATRPLLTYGAEYENSDSDQDKHQTVQGFLRSTRRLGTGNLSLYASDAYTMTEPSSFAAPGQGASSVNSLGAGGSYSARLFNAAQMTFTAKYLNLSGDTPGRDDVSLGLTLQWGYGKISASLLSQVNWRRLAGNSSQDESVRLKLSRYF